MNHCRPRLRSRFLTCSLLLLASRTISDEAICPRTILLAADRARGNLDGIEWNIEVNAIEHGRLTSETLQVRAQANNALAITREPPARRGNTLLLNEGRLWFYKPGLSRPVPISPRQRLLGLASYGDIAITDYANQYHATRLEDDLLDGEACWVFDLRAQAPGVLYDHIRWWVSRNRQVGIKAAYFTVSGKPLKSARLWYDHHVNLADGRRMSLCSKIVIRNELLPEESTTLLFSKPVLAPHPPGLFNVNRLGR